MSQFGEISHKRIWLVKGFGGGGEGRAGRWGHKFWPAREDRTVRKRKPQKAKKVKETKRGAKVERTVSTDVRKRKHKAKKMTT